MSSILPTDSCYKMGVWEQNKSINGQINVSIFVILFYMKMCEGSSKNFNHDIFNNNMYEVRE